MILYVYSHSLDLICSKCVSLCCVVDGTGRALSIWSVRAARGGERTDVPDVILCVKVSVVYLSIARSDLSK